MKDIILNTFRLKLILFIVCLFPILQLPAQEKAQPLRIIMIGAHPDDCDYKGGGTAAIFASLGHAVKFVSVTNGDAGHQHDKGATLAARRKKEAEEAGRRLGVVYDVLDNHDGLLMPTPEVRLQVIQKIREWNADVVIGPRPNDYHPDHRYTGILVQDAAYMVSVPNISPETPPLKKTPVFLYFQDFFRRPNLFRPDIAIDISDVFIKKISGLDAHTSQMYEWLPWISGDSASVPAGPKERVEWLTNTRTVKITEQVRASLSKWYGKEKASAVKHAEAFEICEYGKQPDDSEIRRLFPMLK